MDTSSFKGSLCFRQFSLPTLLFSQGLSLAGTLLGSQALEETMTTTSVNYALENAASVEE